MCGRYGLELSFSALAALLGARPLPDFEGATWGPDFNIAPTDRAPVVQEVDGERRLGLFRWGLVPFWAKRPAGDARLINARAETAASKPAFRRAFAERRLLVPASGWYEWTPAPASKGPSKARPTPHWLHPPTSGLLMLAGLGEHWVDGETGESFDSFTVLTTEATPELREIHDRMPLVLAPGLQSLWLSQDTPVTMLQDLLQPFVGPIAHHEVSTAVNSVRADGPDLIARVGAPRQGRLEF